MLLKEGWWAFYSKRVYSFNNRETVWSITLPNEKPKIIVGAGNNRLLSSQAALNKRQED